MARWTEEDISTFWEMRRGGASLKEIADAIGRTLSSVEQKSMILNKSKEETKMEVETNNTAPETKTEVNAPAEAPDNPAPKLDGAIRQALDMIASQGLEFLDMNVSLNNDGAAMVLHFVRR
jgi:hypothetical protein